MLSLKTVLFTNEAHCWGMLRRSSSVVVKLGSESIGS